MIPTGADPCLLRALVRWQAAAGPYWHYVAAAPFVTGVAAGPPGSPPRPGRRARALLRSCAAVAGPTLVVVDLPLGPLLAAAPALLERGFAVVAAIDRIAARPAVIASTRLLGRLVAVGERLRPATGGAGVVLLVDGERAGRPAAPRAPRPGGALDNRYEHDLGGLPPAGLLRGRGVVAARWIGAPGIAPDLAPYARRLAAAGLEPRLIGLGT